jgi:hypothetical protein
MRPEISHISSGDRPVDVPRDHAQEQRSPCALTGASVLLLAFILALSTLPGIAAAGEAAPQQASIATRSPEALFPPHLPVYRILLRVHLAESNRRPEAFKPILAEINEIWLSQAGICFEMEAVLDDRPAEQGLDLWFMPDLSGGPDLNGYYRSDHDIHVRDTPNLMSAEHPARHPAARTAAHELGHGLSLIHRQDSDDNLMRSKTFGWRLNAGEVDEARRTAAKKALPDTAPVRCGEPRIGHSLKRR